jgi:hypothetical protein
MKQFESNTRGVCPLHGPTPLVTVPQESTDVAEYADDRKSFALIGYWSTAMGERQ